MSKIHFVNEFNPSKKSADLRFSYLPAYTSSDKRIYAECETLMDFIDTMETENFDRPAFDDFDVEAVFFDKEILKKHFDTIEELLEHCKAITE